YRLLTANLPFKADTAIAMAQKQVKDPATPLRRFRAELPAWCQDILDRALAKAPEDRFQTADEFRTALGHAGASSLATGPGSATTETHAMSGMDVTVPPNVMVTPVTGVRNTVAVEPAPAPSPGRTSNRARQLALPIAAVGLIVAMGAGILLTRRRAVVETTASATAASVATPASRPPVPATASSSADTAVPTTAPASIPTTTQPAAAPPSQ